MITRVMRATFAIVLLATLAFGTTATAQDPVGQVEQALHDNVVATYETVSSFLGDMEGSVSDVASSTYDTATSEFAALEDRIGGAVDMVGGTAVAEYRDIQHRVQGLAGDADGFLHRSGHEIESLELDAWVALQGGYDSVANAIDQVIDNLR